MAAEGSVMSNPPRQKSAVVRRRWWAGAAAVVAVGLARAGDPLPLEAPPLPPLPLPPMVAAAKQEPKQEPKKEVGKEPAKENGNGKEKDAPKPPPWKAWQPPGRPISLGECLRIAEQRQPAVVAAQHSVSASVRGYLAVANIHRALELFSPDLPFRRRQAHRGIAAATAEVQKVIQESVYDTTRVYFEYVRATQQEQTAADIIEQMESFYRLAVDLLNTGAADPKKLNKFTVYVLEEAIVEIRQLRDRASTGRRLAVAALRQAMGVEPDVEVYPADTKLPVMGGQVTEEQVVGFALAGRPELVQVSVLVDVTRLEVCAQGAIRHRKSVPTFASGGDLHSRMLPAAVRNGEYRPGAVSPEMPANLVGNREERVARAVALSDRQDEVYRATVALVRLEAVNAYLNWKATAERMEEAEKRFERGKKLVEESRVAAVARQDPELLVRNEALAGKAQANYVEAVYEHLKALMTLERVTAGQVRAGFTNR